MCQRIQKNVAKASFVGIAVSRSRVVHSSITRDCHTVRLTITPNEDPCVPDVISQSQVVASPPCSASFIPNISCARSACDNSTRERSRNKMTNRTVTGASRSCSVKPQSIVDECFAKFFGYTTTHLDRWLTTYPPDVMLYFSGQFQAACNDVSSSLGLRLGGENLVSISLS
uniref:Uncharacterized protein n=1 Tax=Cacopsylla melanoneura TaxID=428564 RepID=A0A8D8LQL1_9HEMI